MSEYTPDQIIQAASALINKAVNDLIYKDPHQWSGRGCATCRAITKLSGMKFGCIRYAAERKAIREKTKC